VHGCVEVLGHAHALPANELPVDVELNGVVHPLDGEPVERRQEELTGAVGALSDHPIVILAVVTLLPRPKSLGARLVAPAGQHCRPRAVLEGWRRWRCRERQRVDGILPFGAVDDIGLDERPVGVPVHDLHADLPPFVAAVPPVGWVGEVDGRDDSGRVRRLQLALKPPVPEGILRLDLRRCEGFLRHRPRLGCPMA